MSHNHTSDPQLNTSEGAQSTNNAEEIEEIEGSSGQAGLSSGSQTLGEFYKEMIRSIRDNLTALKDLYKRTLTVEIEDESSRMSRQIDLLISETSRISSQISHKLAVMEQSNKSLEGQDQARKRLTQKHATLAKSFMDEMTKYRRMQMENAGKYRNKIAEEYRKVNPDATQEEIDQLIDNDINKIQSSEQSNQSRTILAEIKDRQRDVRRIEKSINELNKMFSEVQALVIEKDDTVHTTKFIEVTDISPSEQIEFELPKKRKR
ncbi:20070_t:CDS:2, partial [Racocetra fulgida]